MSSAVPAPLIHRQIRTFPRDDYNREGQRGTGATEDNATRRATARGRHSSRNTAEAPRVLFLQLPSFSSPPVLTTLKLPVMALHQLLHKMFTDPSPISCLPFSFLDFSFLHVSYLLRSFHYTK